MTFYVLTPYLYGMKENDFFIWEENDSTAQKMKLESRPISGQNDGTNEIKNVSVKKGCEDTGKVKTWKNNCVKCGKEKSYDNKKSLNRSIRNGNLCRSCSKMGVTIPEEIRRKISNTKKGKPSWNKGIPWSEETKKKMSDVQKGRKLPIHIRQKLLFYAQNQSEETRKKISLASKGHRNWTPPCSEEKRRKIRLSIIRYIENKKFNGGQMMPGYNIFACKYFDDLSKEKNWNLQHAQNGGEFFVKDLGYWVDAYDKEKNVVVEYDERHHDYRKNKDFNRMKEIKKHLKCRFFRYNQKLNELKEY